MLDFMLIIIFHVDYILLFSSIFVLEQGLGLLNPLKGNCDATVIQSHLILLLLLLLMNLFIYLINYLKTTVFISEYKSVES